MAMTDMEPILGKDRVQSEIPILHKLNRWQWWLLVGLNIVFLIVGQIVAVLLGRFYYDQGGSSTFMSTIVQTIGFPILFVPLLLLPPSPSSAPPSKPLSRNYICVIYVALGLLLALDNYFYSIGLLYLSASTYSLICASQLAFNAVFAFFLNSQKFTPWIISSVVVISISATLLGLNEDSDAPEGVTKSQYVIGFLCTLAASAIGSLLLSLMQLTFEKALKRETFAVVLEMQIYTSVIASIFSVVGLIASGQWSSLSAEMDTFQCGKTLYVTTLISTSIGWQVSSVGMVGLIFLVSSLFSNVISTVAYAVAPIASLIVFNDTMNDVKIAAMLLALLGFAFYLYQNYIDEPRTTQSQRSTEATYSRVAS